MNCKLHDGVTLEYADGTYVFLKANGDAAVPDFIGGEIVNQLLLSDVDSCVQYVSKSYGIDCDAAKADIEEFICALEKYELLEKIDE
jgi:hypothetical protein